MSRYYDPVTHRFINADGYFQAGGGILDCNTLAYCGNNPIIRTDPTGEHYCGDPTCVICNKNRWDFVNDNYEWIMKVNPFFTMEVEIISYNIWGDKITDYAKVTYNTTDPNNSKVKINVSDKTFDYTIYSNDNYRVYAIIDLDLKDVCIMGGITKNNVEYSYGYGKMD